MRVFLDFETRSEVNIGKLGASKYTKDLVCLLCLAYQIDDGPVQLWENDGSSENLKDLFDAIEAGAEMHAYNAAFERQVWENHCVPKLGWPPVRPDQWHCTAAQAAASALPRSLGNCGKALRVKQLKSDVGKRVMLKMCKPRRPTKNNPSHWHDDPADYRILYDYCIDDVKAERAIDEVTRPLSEHEREVWLMDQTINLRGVPLDLELAEAALELWESHKDTLDAEMTEITDGFICSSDSGVRATSRVARILEWLDLHGLATETINKEFLSVTLKREDLTHKMRRVLELRQEAANTSVAKFEKMIAVAEEDGRVRGCHQYHGANTGRWAGRLIQVQNIPRGGLSREVTEHATRMVKARDPQGIEMIVGPVGKVLSSLLRSTICAPPGKKLIAADYASVEARGLAWLAGQDDLVEEFRNGADVYCEMAAVIFSEPASSFGPKSTERQLGKACILGAGYGMGVKTFHDTCHRWGMKWVDKELAERAILAYREKNWRIRQYLSKIDEIAKAAIAEPGQAYTVSGTVPVTFQVDDRWLYCQLPSGRRLAWLDPEMAMQRMPSPPFDPGTMKPTICFTGTDMAGKPTMKRTYGGMLVENICQGVCRDLLAHAMLELERQGYPVIFHVHDEVICEVDDDKSKSVGDVRRIMNAGPEWADGFPIESDGFEAERYRK